MHKAKSKPIQANAKGSGIHDKCHPDQKISIPHKRASRLREMKMNEDVMRKR